MPVAQQSGKLLIQRLKLRAEKMTPEEEIIQNFSTEYDNIPTTVFSPTEYSFVGLNEQEAISKYGEANVEVYHRETVALQHSIYKENTKVCYMKVITLLSDKERVIGMHYYGPAADEVIGGFAVAMKLGMKKSDLDRTIGVHPSVSEDLFNMQVTKRSGKEFRKTDC